MVDNVTAQRPATGTASRALNIVLWVLQVLLAVGFAFSAIAKFTGSPQAVAVFEAMGTASWMPYAIGTLEVAGAIGLLIPRLCGTAAWAFVALMVGALISHLIFGGDPVPAVGLFVISLVVAWGRRSNAAALLASRSRPRTTH